MKNPVISSEVMAKLSDFENLESVFPSEEWKKTLTERLTSVKPHTGSGIISTKYKVVLLIAIVVNLGIVCTSVINKAKNDKHKELELQIISNELFVNPISMNH